MIALAFGVTTLVFGAIGLAKEAGDSWSGEVPKLAYETAGLLFLQSPHAPPPADNLPFAYARLFAVFWASLGGASLLLELSRPASDAVLRGMLRLSRRPRVVVIGLGAVGGPVTSHLLEDGHPTAVVTLDEGSQYALHARRGGALVIVGDATDRRVRRRARVGDAADVIIVAGDDATNLELAGEILLDVEAGPRPKSPINCYIHMSSPTFTTSLSAHRLLQSKDRDVVFRIFDLHEQAARDALLREGDGILRTVSPQSLAHFIVIGFGANGQTMALQMARLAHFEDCRRLRMTVVDHFSDEHQRFLERHPGFCPDPSTFSLLDHARLGGDKDSWSFRHWRPADTAWRSEDADAIEYAVNAEFLNVDSEALVPREVREKLIERLWPEHNALEPLSHRVIVVCYDDERRNFETVLWLREFLEAECLERERCSRIPVYVHLPTEPGLARLLTTSPDFVDSAAIDVRSYGSYAPQELFTRITQPRLRAMAKVVQDRFNVTVGGQDAFDDLSPGFQASNIDVAAHAAVKIDAIGYRARPTRRDEAAAILTPSREQVEMLARMEHNRWIAERLASGWRFGDKQLEKVGDTTHENRRRRSLVPWEQLIAMQPREVEKDTDQVRALSGMYWAAGETLEPQRDR
jgi:hypothetical protein